MCLCGSVHLRAGALGIWRASDSPGAGDPHNRKVVMLCLMWVQGQNLSPLQEQLLAAWTPLKPQLFYSGGRGRNHCIFSTECCSSLSNQPHSKEMAQKKERGHEMDPFNRAGEHSNLTRALQIRVTWPNPYSLCLGYGDPRIPLCPQDARLHLSAWMGLSG